MVRISQLPPRPPGLEGSPSSPWPVSLKDVGMFLGLVFIGLLILLAVIGFVRSVKTSDEIHQDYIKSEGKRLQQEWDEERDRKRRQMEIEIEAIKEDVKKHPGRYGN
jgi:hypothetical protein